MSSRAFHRQRPIVAVAACLGEGLVLGIWWRSMLVWLPLAGLGVALALLVTSLRTGKPIVLSICIGVVFGGVLLGHAAAWPSLPPEGRYSALATVQGVVEQRETDGRMKAVLRRVTLSDEQGRQWSVPRAYFTWYPEQKNMPLPLDGQRFRFSTRLYHPSGQVNPHGFDFRMHLLQRGISVGLSGARDLVLEGAPEPSIWLRARQGIGDLLDRVLGVDSALPKALLLGDRDDLPQETMQTFRQAGIAHVLAVSGLHVSILILGMGLLLGLLHAGPKTQLIIIAVFLLLYARLLDFSAPVVRASILGVLLLMGRVSRQRVDSLTALAWAFIFIVLLRPLDIIAVGFQLSFSAVLGIILLGDRLEYLFSRYTAGRRLPKRLRSAASAVFVTVAASLFTAPLVALHFYQVSFVGLLLSPVACLLVGGLMMASIVILPIAVLWLPAAQWLAWPVVMLSRTVLGLTQTAANLEGGHMQVPAPSMVLVVAAYTLMVLSSRYVRASGKVRAGVALLALIMVSGMYFAKAPAPLKWTQLSMGSADAAIVEDGQTAYVVDAGAHGGDLASYLRAKGLAVDTLFITHLHNDHVGGLSQLLDAGVPIGRIALPEGAMQSKVDAASIQLLRQAEEAGIPVQFMAAGDTLETDSIQMRVLWPEKSKVYPGREANLHSLSMLWTLDGYTLLTTGDLDGQYEMYSAHPAQMLKLAHHGSRHSSSIDYLRAVSPQVALLSTSATHQERATDVLERLQTLGVQVYDTPGHGALTISFGVDGPQIQGHLRPEER